MPVLKWIAPIVALLAVLLLPAIEATAPLAAPQGWTIAQVATAAVRPQSRHSLQDAIHRVRDLEPQFNLRPSPAQRRALWIAGAIPVALLLAGAAALLSFLWLLLGWRRALIANAALGCAACVYSLIAAWWLTRVVQTAAAQLLESAQQGPLGGVLSQLGVKPLPQFAAQFALSPQAALWVLLLAFLAMLVWPR
ncbi:MAG TPA: hypothetical protein VFP94_09695 [Terriglobales bacterium]|nr:hypothetical protein [Terriglobales bacterium]